jgi:hypothetical protein
MNRPVEQTLLDKLQQLPPERLAEVEDFVDFLRSRESERALAQGCAETLAAGGTGGRIRRALHVRFRHVDRACGDGQRARIRAQATRAAPHERVAGILDDAGRLRYADPAGDRHAAGERSAQA